MSLETREERSAGHFLETLEGSGTDRNPYRGAERSTEVGGRIPIFDSLSAGLRDEILALPKEHADLLCEYIDQKLKAARQADPLGEWAGKLTRETGCHYGDSQYDFAASNEPEKSASGGNRSGKSMTGCGIDVVIAGPDPYPDWWPKRYRHDKSRPRYVWICCVDRNVQVEPGGIQTTILNLIPPGQIRTKPKVPGQAEAIQFIEFWDGSRISFKVYGAGRDVFQSAGIHHIHFDEEPPEDVYIEAFQRGVETKSTMIITYTPVKGVTWLYNRLIETGIVPVWNFATEDNPIVDLEELERRDKGLTTIEKLIRRRGKTIPLVGKPRFDTILLANWAINSREPHIWIELLEDPGNPDGPPIVNELKDKDDGWMPIALYVDPRRRPEWENRWVIGVDSSDGVPGGSEQSAFVWDRHLQQEAAVVHGRWDLELAWSPLVKRLSMFFRDAFVCAERNNMGVLLVKYLVNTGVPQYIQEIAGSSFDGYREEFGFYQLVQAKSQSEAHAVTLMNGLGKTLWLYYEPLIHQLLTYERQASGVGKAAEGTHDDIVTSALLAWQMELQAPPMRSPLYHKQQREKQDWDRNYKSAKSGETSFMGA